MAPRAEAQRLVIAAGPHPDGITNQQDDLQQSHHQKGEGSADDVDLSNLLERSRPQSSSASHSTGASSLKDERGRRLSRGTFLAVDNEFVASQVGHLGKPTPSVQISAPEEQPRILPDDEEESRAPSRHSDFKSITTIDDFGFSVGLTQNNWSGPRRRASSNSLHPHYLGDGTQTPAYQPDDGDTPSTFIGLGEMFSPSLPARSATVEELGKDLDDESYLTYVNRQLRDEFEYSQHDAHGGLEFLPLGKLVLLLDEKKISHVLRRALSGTAEKINTLTSAIHSPNHQDSRRMILAVLILIDKVVCIEDLIHNDIRDIHLPLRLHKGKKRCSAVQIQKRSAIEVICLDKWKWSEMESFINMQYRVLAPFFDMPLDDLHFYKIDDVGIILPFLEWKKKTSGGYGTVWKVQIHSDHHNFANLDVSILKRTMAWF